ncbi:MAG: RNA polymerase sigma factor [Bdellovibrionales bacterium]
MTRDELAALIRQYSKPLIRYANSILKDVETAKEVVQECFLKVFAYQTNEIRIPGWLYREVRNRSIDIWRHRRKINTLEPETEENLISGHPNPLEGLEVRQDLEVVVKHVRTLSARDQEVLRLKYGEGLSYEQIGEALGLTATNVGYILCQAIKHLRESAVVPGEGTAKKYGE